MKILDLAMAVVDGKIKLADALLQVNHRERDVFENVYIPLCEANGHDVASSELGAFDGKD